MYVCVSALSLLLSAIAAGESKSEPVTPNIIINNYLPGSAAPATQNTVAVEAVPQSAPSSSSTENEPEGLSVGILAGYLSDGSTPMAAVGLNPKLRFLRFFTLEAEGLAGVANLKQTRTSSSRSMPLALSGQLAFSLTFRSAIFDFTPRGGIGVTSRRMAGIKYEGVHYMLGTEVGIGRLRISGELRAGDRQTYESGESAERGASGYYCDDYHCYASDSGSYYYSYSAGQYSETRLSAAFLLSERGRMGVNYSETRKTGQLNLFYQFGL